MNFQEIYKNNMLNEGRIEDIKSRYSSQFSPDHIDEVIDQALPDHDKKHVDWVMKHYSNGNIKPTDFSAVKKYLDVYEKNKSKINRGLSSANGVKDLKELVKPYTNVGLTKEQRLAKNQKVVYEDEHLKIESHKGAEACEDMGWLPKNNEFYGQLDGKAKWCISLGNGANKGFLDKYTENGKWPVHTITVKKNNRKHALVLNETESTPEFRDERDHMVSSRIFLSHHPSIVNSSSGDFLLNHTDVDEKFKDFLEKNIKGKDYDKISSGELHNFYNNHVNVENDNQYIPDVRDFIIKHPNTTHHTLKTMFDDHNTSYASLLSHKNYNLDDDLKESLSQHSPYDYKIERIVKNGHLKPHHVDQILNTPGFFDKNPDCRAYLPSNKNAEWSSHSIDKFYNDDAFGDTYHKAALYHNKNCSIETRKKILTDISNEGFPEHYSDVYSSEYTKHPDLVKHLLNFTDMNDKASALNIIKTHNLMGKEPFEKEASNYLNEGIRNKKIPEDHLFHKGSLFNLVKGLSKTSLHSLDSTLQSTYGSSDLAAKLKKSIKTNISNENLNDRYDFIKDKLGENAFHNNSFGSDTLNELNDKNTIDAMSKSSGLTDFYGKPNESSFYGAMSQYLNFKNKPKTFEHIYSKMKEHGADFRYALGNNTLTPDQLSTVYHSVNKNHYLDDETIHKLITNNEADDSILDDLHSRKLLNAGQYREIYKRDNLSEDMLKKHIDDHMKTIIDTPNGKNAISSRKRIEEILSSPSSSDRIAKHFIDNYSTRENSRTSPEERKYSFDNTYTHVRNINDKIAKNKQYSANIKTNIADKNLSDNAVLGLIKNKELSSRGLHSIVTNHPNIIRNNYDSVITHPNLSLKSLNHMIDNNLVPEADKNHALRMFQEKAGQQLLPFKGIKK